MLLFSAYTSFLFYYCIVDATSSTCAVLVLKTWILGMGYHIYFLQLLRKCEGGVHVPGGDGLDGNGRRGVSECERERERERGREGENRPTYIAYMVLIIN